MQSRHVIAVLLIMLCVPLAPFASSTSGRAAPSCTSESASTFASQVPVDDGECVELSLGLLTPGDVYEITILVIDDALDVLVFDEAGLQPYLLGQSYRSAYQQVPSTESANGSYTFHWKVPLSIAEKSWTIVVDNLAHDGDQGNGDQGGDIGRASISVTKLTDGQWTMYHDLVGVVPNGHITLLEGDDLRLEEGTTVSVTAWSLEGNGDVYLQTESMNANYLSGQSNVALTGASLLGVDGTASFNWIVSEALANQPLKLVVDNSNDPDGQGDGSSNLRITMRVELVPVMRSSFTAENQSVVLNAPLNFDASSSPNNLQQIEQYVWDFDASVDSNNDGDAINDVDAVGMTASSSWATLVKRPSLSPFQANLDLTAHKPTLQLSMKRIQSPVFQVLLRHQAPSFQADGKSNMIRRFPSHVLPVPTIMPSMPVHGPSMVRHLANKPQHHSTGLPLVSMKLGLLSSIRVETVHRFLPRFA